MAIEPAPADHSGRPTRRTGILRRPCPHCGQVSLRRVVEAAGATEAGRRPGGTRHTHMRCTAAGCSFDGWVARRSRRRQLLWWTQRRWRQLGQRLRPWLRGGALAAVVGLGGGVAAMAGAAWERAHGPTAAAQREALPPGEYHDGDPLPPVHPLVQPAARARSPLDLRGACVWGRPGRNPYRGSVAEALRAAGLPVAVQAALVAKVAARQRDGRLRIANDGIHEEAGARVFAARGFAMTYGHTLCLETRVNFAPGHSEPADLYEASDTTGRRYSMMLPDVCGNVSLISEGGGTLPPQLRLRTAVDGDPGQTRTVPAPGTLALVLAGLLALARLSRHSRR
jgi:hypothetical protein